MKRIIPCLFLSFTFLATHVNGQDYFTDAPTAQKAAEISGKNIFYTYHNIHVDSTKLFERYKRCIANHVLMIPKFLDQFHICYLRDLSIDSRFKAKLANRSNEEYDAFSFFVYMKSIETKFRTAADATLPGLMVNLTNSIIDKRTNNYYKMLEKDSLNNRMFVQHYIQSLKYKNAYKYNILPIVNAYVSFNESKNVAKNNVTFTDFEQAIHEAKTTGKRVYGYSIGNNRMKEKAADVAFNHIMNRAIRTDSVLDKFVFFIGEVPDSILAIKSRNKADLILIQLNGDGSHVETPELLHHQVVYKTDVENILLNHENIYFDFTMFGIDKYSIEKKNYYFYKQQFESRRDDVEFLVDFMRYLNEGFTNTIDYHYVMAQYLNANQNKISHKEAMTFLNNLTFPITDYEKMSTAALEFSTKNIDKFYRGIFIKNLADFKIFFPPDGNDSPSYPTVFQRLYITNGYINDEELERSSLEFFGADSDLGLFMFSRIDGVDDYIEYIQKAVNNNTFNRLKKYKVNTDPSKLLMSMVYRAKVKSSFLKIADFLVSIDKPNIYETVFDGSDVSQSFISELAAYCYYLAGEKELGQQVITATELRMRRVSPKYTSPVPEWVKYKRFNDSNAQNTFFKRYY